MQSDVSGQRKETNQNKPKQMDVFQLNTFPAGGITMKTPDSGLMSGGITIARLQSCS